MKKYILLLFYLSNFLLNAQINSGLAVYKKVQIKKGYTKKNKKHLSKSRFKRWAKMEEEIIKAHKKISFDLLFVNKKSVFIAKKTLNNEGKVYLEMAVGPDGAGTFYNNSNKENIRQLNAFGQEFLISKPKYKWAITKEKKKIGKYICYKATTIEKVKTRRGIKKHLVTAWFTPQINVPFGPLGYSGLPGLILELEARNYKYYTTKIKLNPKEEIKITKPTKGKKVTQEEFYDIAIGTMKDLRKRKGF